MGSSNGCVDRPLIECGIISGPLYTIFIRYPICAFLKLACLLF